jgi:hypothetical protein
MPTTHALGPVEVSRRRVRRRPASRVPAKACPDRTDHAKSRAGKTPKDRERWLRPLVMALIVIGEWLLLVADVFAHVYLLA